MLTDESAVSPETDQSLPAEPTDACPTPIRQRIKQNAKRESMPHRSALLFLLLLLMVGCAERAWIRTAPPGAKIYVNDRFIGITPVVYSVHRPEFDFPLRYRVELDGYEPAQGELQKRIGPPRIVGACFTLGLSLIFKPPTTLRDRYDIPLQLAPREAGARPVPAPELPHAATPAEVQGDNSVRARLRELQDLYDRGIITEQEFKRTRDRVLRDL